MTRNTAKERAQAILALAGAACTEKLVDGVVELLLSFDEQDKLRQQIAAQRNSEDGLP